MTTQNTSEESKSAVIKSLAILGSIVILIIGVWLAVQIVRALPAGFASLASIAENLYGTGTKDQFDVQPETNSIESGDMLTITLPSLEADGTYQFSYECAEGVAAALRANGTVDYIDCDETFSFSKTDEVGIFITSEKYRVSDVSYSLTFTETGANEPVGEYAGAVTVTNNAIAALPADGGTDVAYDEPEEIEPEVADEPEEEPETPTTPSTPAEPTYRTVQFTYIPVSLDNGFTDLRTTVLATGYIKGRSFYPSFVVDNDSRAAIQVEVKNLGTKTSDRFDLDVELPNGDDYTADNQQGLKPNERVVFTIEFDAEDETGDETFEADVQVDHDKNDRNNRVRGTMRFVN